ncbi:abl interactor 2 [Condylostylus longicornis]|uniref:abl interactor 2 n=1 Tax=Condylostylus longicornis TaxID=2530218 RepID=UPI00244E030B|nr:abl interactor 2 [Condylostylus longicornis]
MNRYSYYTDTSCQDQQSVMASESIMDELATLLRTEIPEGRQSLLDSFTNLERVADYCEDTYYRSDNKRAALEATKNYTTQSLASVAYQINTLAYSFMQLLDLQVQQLSEMESQLNHSAQTVMIHKEKVARREIGVLTANKVSSRQYKIVAPINPEKPIKYVRKPIDYSILDSIGHGINSSTNRAKLQHRGSSQGSIQSASTLTNSSGVGPAPTTKPPTPPQLARSGNPGSSGTLNKSITNTGTLGRGSREYRTPSAVIPPQVPSHYAPNYPIGHPKRQSSNSGNTTVSSANNPITTTSSTTVTSERGSGYSALPIPPSQQIATHVNLPSAGMMQNLPPPPPVTSMPPPPPLSVTHELPESHAQSHIGMHTLGRNINSLNFNRPGSQSPPLPPPPPPEDEHQDFGRPRSSNPSSGGPLAPIVPDDQNLPGWVPKNYIEKVVAIYDYYADKDDELSFQESSVLYVLKKNDDGWWEGVMDGVTGLFPGNYVEPCV